MNLIFGYARTSTADQKAGLEAQVEKLHAQGAARIYQEQISASAPRQELDTAIEHLRPGDTLMVTKVDRLARSVSDLVAITERIKGKGAYLKILDLNLDTSSPTSTLILNILGSIAQFERELMLERQREGIARAKKEGKYTGRKPTARAKADEVMALLNGGMTREGAAHQLGIGVASVYRILREHKPAPEVKKILIDSMEADNSIKKANLKIGKIVPPGEKKS